MLVRGGLITRDVAGRLWFGVLAGILLCLAIGGLGLLVPGYSQVHQTVSEIGEVGSPARVPFTLVIWAVAACLVVFASALKHVSRDAGHSAAGAYVVVAMAVSAAGVGTFAYPHPLHNVFGLSELIGYQAPLVFAITWRRDARRDIVAFSWAMYLLVVLAMVANLSALDRNGAVWAYERPVYGVVQRLLFGAWFVWCMGVAGLLLRTKAGEPVTKEHVAAE